MRFATFALCFTVKWYYNRITILDSFQYRIRGGSILIKFTFLMWYKAKSSLETNLNPPIPVSFIYAHNSQYFI